MNLFVSEIVTQPASLPITATDEALAAAVVEKLNVAFCGVPSCARSAASCLMALSPQASKSNP